MPISENSSKFIFLRKEKAGPDVYSFFFKRPPGFLYLPGQYIRMTVNGEKTDNRSSTRFFTIASSPTEEDYIFITTRIIQSAFKMNLSALQEGEKVVFDGPFGNFTLDENNKKPLVFLAGGIGITPFRSMIKYVFDKNLDIPITLFSSFGRAADIIFREDFIKAQEKLKQFKYIIVITKPVEAEQIHTDETGRRIDGEMIEKYVKNIYDCQYYIVGPTVMVTDAVVNLKDMGIAGENIKSENFPGY